MLLDKVLNSFVCVLNFFLSRTDFLRAGSVRIGIAIGQLLLFQTLLVHLINQEVHILTHLLELIS